MQGIEAEAWEISFPAKAARLVPPLNTTSHSWRISGISRVRRVWRRGQCRRLGVMSTRARPQAVGRGIQGRITRAGDRPKAILRLSETQRSHRVVASTVRRRRVGNRGRKRRVRAAGTGRQAQAVQDSYCGGGRTNCSQDFHSSAAMVTLKNVHQEDTFHQLRPRIVAIAHRRLRAGLRLNRRHGGLLGRRLRFHLGVPAILIPVWNDQGSPGGSRAKYSVIPGQVSARRWHQDRQFGDEVLTLENDRDGSVTPWTFRT